MVEIFCGVGFLLYKGIWEKEKRYLEEFIEDLWEAKKKNLRKEK